MAGVDHVQKQVGKVSSEREMLKNKKAKRNATDKKHCHK